LGGLDGEDVLDLGQGKPELLGLLDELDSFLVPRVEEPIAALGSPPGSRTPIRS